MDVIWKENNIFYNILCILITENEKLFDRSDARLYWKTVYHMMAIFHHVFVVNFAAGVNLESDTVEVQRLKKFRLAYLTGWNFSFQTTFLCFALTHDVLQWFDKDDSRLGKKIRYLRDVVFNGLVFPFTCFVNFMFWALYWIDRELVFPQVYDQILPWWLNHCVHTNIIIVIIVETILTSRRYPTDVVVERVLYVFVNIFYAVVFYSIYFFAGCWLYGVFGVMTWWQVCIYQCGNWCSCYVFYRMAFFLNRLIHDSKSSEEISTQNKSNGDVESKDAKQFGSELKTTGADVQIAYVEKTQADHSKQLKNNFVEAKENSNEETLNRDNGIVNRGHIGDEDGSNGTMVNGINGEVIQNGQNGENEKDWKSIENGGEVDGNGTFDKSWSTKYRTSRNQFENSSL